MSFPAYPEYTDSGFQWLGAVPSSWPSVPFGVLFRRIKRTDHGDEELLSVYRDYGVIRKSDRDDNFNNPSDDMSSYQLVEPGDLAMNKMKAWQGSLGVSELRGIVSPAYFVFSPRKQYHPPFMHYLLRSPPYAAGYMTISKGIRINQWDVDPDHLTSLPVLFPSTPEQQAIATFLDRETAKIDELVAEQERLIALLKEKRQAVISHAVTKGLDPDAPMKDSGIEWLGDIPAHWDAAKVARHFRGSKGKEGQLLTKEYCAEHAGEYPVYSGQTESEGVMGMLDRYEFDAGDDGFLFSTTVGAKAMSVSHIFGKFSLSQNCMIIRPSSPVIHPRFFFYHFQPAFAYHRAMIPDHMQPSFRMDDLYSFQIGLPPMPEQIEIAKKLDDESETHQALIGDTLRAIGLLKERRAALISAAVTGKIDVRGLVEQHEMEAA